MADSFAAVIMDLDGVVTDTATTHFRAWKQLFDDFLADRDPGAEPFGMDDYRRTVDGRMRIEGVTGFLRSRGIDVPLGHAGDPPTGATAWSLANRKNDLFVHAVRTGGVAAFPSTLRLLRRLRDAGVRTAVVTASRNADLVLATAGAASLFDVKVDGRVAEELSLAGKPDPATFREAARRLGCGAGVCVVVEDAVAGVEAASRGRFGLVVGVDRHGHPGALREAGADIVVSDLAELPADALFAPTDPWTLAYRGFDPSDEGTREALLTVGNGYLATRGAMAHAGADGAHYPGTYVAGVYNRLVSLVGDRAREDESLVNLPDWVPVTFRAVDGNGWASPGEWRMTAHRVALDLRTATLTRTATAIDTTGRRVRVSERRFVSMDDPHLAVSEHRLSPQNWSGTLEVRSMVDAAVRNDNVATQRDLADRHLQVLEGRHDDTVAGLLVQTTQSHVQVAVAARTRLRPPLDIDPEATFESDGSVGHRFRVEVDEGDEVVIEKVVGVVTSRDHAISEPLAAAIEAARQAGGFEALRHAHTQRWHALWDQFRVGLAGGSEQALALRVHLFHLLATLSVHTIELDAGVPARGLHGEGYQGHVFWDELFVFPVLDLHLPELTHELLLYRWRRLPWARRLAAAEGAEGARFPWQSGSDGREETPAAFLNPRSGRWMVDHSRRQCHGNVAVAYNAWRHWQVTGDLGYLVRYGAELLVESARYFASRATYDPESDRYDLGGVMGPDEFHDSYPDGSGDGIDNNAYVNVMASWVLSRARETYDLLGAHLGGGLWHRLEVDLADLDRWDHVSRRLRVPFLSNGLLAQFDGYGDLEELDWSAYRERYGDIGRLDLILEAEGDTTNRYQVSKQADALMLFYLLDAEELTGLLTRLGYAFDPATIPATVDHYLARTTHGSTLSRVVHAWVLARTDRARSWELFRDVLRTDLADTQGGTTREGVHLGAMAGSFDLLQRCYTGLDARGDVLWFNPLLPEDLASLGLRLRYRNQIIDVQLDHDELVLTAAPGPAPPVSVAVAHVEERRALAAGESLRFALATPAPVPRRLVRRRSVP